MTDVAYYVAASLDGFIATPDGGVEWLAPFEGSTEDYGYRAFYDSVDAIVLGARTYEQALGFPEWPYADKPVFVLSHRKLHQASTNVAITAETPEQLVARLTDDGFARIWLVGGGQLAGAFERAGLIGEYIVSVMPVLLGGGVRMLGDDAAESALVLRDITRFADGVVQLTYRPADGARRGGPGAVG